MGIRPACLQAGQVIDFLKANWGVGAHWPPLTGFSALSAGFGAESRDTSLTKLFDRHDGLLRGLHFLVEIENLLSCGGDILQVSLKRVVHRLQYVRRVGHIAQIHLFQVLLDFHGAADVPSYSVLSL